MDLLLLKTNVSLWLEKDLLESSMTKFNKSWEVRDSQRLAHLHVLSPWLFLSKILLSRVSKECCLDQRMHLKLHNLDKRTEFCVITHNSDNKFSSTSRSHLSPQNKLVLNDSNSSGLYLRFSSIVLSRASAKFYIHSRKDSRVHCVKSAGNRSLWPNNNIFYCNRIFNLLN